jgi:hypothetical protein
MFGKDKCAFCGATADSGEHTWDDWFGKIIGPKRFTMTRKESDGSLIVWRSSKLNSKTNVVCEKCNTGWMSQLVNRTKLVAKEMILNCQEATLHATDIVTIAAFAFCKSVVADHSHSNREPFFTFAERNLFRQTLSIPRGVQMWLTSMPIQHGLFKSMTLEAPQNTPKRFELNIFTYGLGHLVIQVAGCRWKKKALRRHTHPPILTQPSEWDSCSIPFWPVLTTMPIQWPAKEHLGREIVDDFVQRWIRLERGW